MNYSMVGFILLQMMRIEGLVMILPALVSVFYGEKSATSFLLISAVTVIFSTLASKKKPFNRDIFAKEGLVIVGLSWIVWSLIGALPFVISGYIPNFIDAFFETVSGFTTTGSTILTDIEALPKGLLFWRSFTHWIGGMGVLVFVMAIMPLAENRSMYIMRAEVPGPVVGKLVPRTKQTAKILYSIYIGLTLVEVVFLLIGKMSLYDAVVHAFSTAGTGGFSVKNSSIAYYDSAYIDAVITIFMFLFGVNFNIFFMFVLRKFKVAFKNEELRVYFGIVVIATIVITLNITNSLSDVLTSLRYASFQVVSVMTTTGFVTANFDLWPSLSKFILILLMIIGASAGSTGGGVKVSRVIILVKAMIKELKMMLHPRSVAIIHLDKKTVDRETIRSVFIYFSTYVMLLIVSMLFVSFNNLDFETSLTSVLTCLSNVGPGLGKIVGPVENFSSLSYFTKFILSIDMLIGRLEIFPILLLFSPTTWKKRF